MKKVLVVGADSFIARSFIDIAKGRLDVRGIPGLGEPWKETDFKGYDAVLLCAGLAHQKQTAQSRTLYDAVNREMAVLIAQKAKAAGVSQFVFLSSMSVYGLSRGVVTAGTQPCPKPGDAYGLSKWNAEQELEALRDQRFTLTVLRPPMVYGPDCPGNFQRLLKLVRRAPVFPALRNSRSMIFSEDLALLICALIEKGLGGVFCPQNKQPVCTANLAWEMGQAAGRPVRLTRLLNPAARLTARLLPAADKLWGSLIYAPELSVIPGIDYQVSGLRESVFKSIGK